MNNCIKFGGNTKISYFYTLAKPNKNRISKKFILTTEMTILT